jgi:hypothetical protein
MAKKLSERYKSFALSFRRDIGYEMDIINWIDETVKNMDRRVSRSSFVIGILRKIYEAERKQNKDE